MKPFESDIQVRPGTGAYRGLWEVYRVSTGDRITDFPTEALAVKAIPKIRKYARERAACDSRDGTSIFRERQQTIRPA